MASSKEIQDRMKSISDTMKITNAMYLISSSKLRKARKNMEQVYDYFHTIRRSIGDILHHIPEMEHRFLEPVDGPDFAGKRAYIVITADKGLAGAYNWKRKQNRNIMPIPMLVSLSLDRWDAIIFCTNRFPLKKIFYILLKSLLCSEQGRLR